MKWFYCSLLAVFGLVLATAAAQAQNTSETDTAEQAKQGKAAADATTLAEWEYNSIYEAGGIRAEYLISEEVFGPKGNEIGNVADAIISADGRIAALIIEVGDFWDMAKTKIVVPWAQVTLTPDGIKIPVSQDNYEQYLLFGEQSVVNMKTLQQQKPVNDIMATGAKTWRLSAMLGDYVVFEGKKGNVGFGYLEDVIFSMKGRIMALIVQSSLTKDSYGPYAFPFEGDQYGWQPYDNVYKLPYSAAVVGNQQPFRYTNFDGYFN